MTSDDRSDKAQPGMVPEVANLGIMRPPFRIPGRDRPGPVAACRMAGAARVSCRERATRGHCSACRRCPIPLRS
jgi:hypothetical protein